MSFPGSRPPGWRLKPIGQYGLPSSIDVEVAGLTLGRDEWSTCRIAGEQWGMVSRVHAKVEYVQGRLYVHDTDSTNGTFVNEERVQSAELASGDVLQLGPKGPKFLVYHAEGGASTELVEVRANANAAVRHGVQGLGQTALLSLKRALGIEETAATASRVERRQTRHIAIAAASLAVLSLAGIVAYSNLRDTGQAAVARVEQQGSARAEALQREQERRAEAIERRARELEAANEELAARFEEGLARFGGELERRIADSYVARAAWDEEREGLRAQRQELERRIAELRASNADASGELAGLSQRLEETLGRLKRMDPQEVEAERLAEVRHVREAVVMIESRVVFREQSTQRLLHSSIDASGESAVNLRDEGVVVDQRSSGSGFVISQSGYILTNAHVAVPSDFRDPMEIDEQSQVVPEVELEIVFSGSAQRHSATLVQYDDEDDQDFALIKIDPFEGMPHLELGDLEQPTPAPGTEVYLCGFPLGTFAVQEGDRVIASTLKGILSRRVGPYVQIDAGVHPGLSGGPVTDARGRVIGVVCSVQATPKGDIAAAIGYALPISAALKLLPADAVH
jgi:S1-C subfamily serine protease